MAPTTSVLKAYINHFLPREVVGPVIIVFSLEGVIDGLFNLYVPTEYATLGWGIVFALSVVLVAYWGTIDEPAVEELRDRIEEIEQEQGGKDGREQEIDDEQEIQEAGEAREGQGAETEQD